MKRFTYNSSASCFSQWPDCSWRIWDTPSLGSLLDSVNCFLSIWKRDQEENNHHHLIFWYRSGNSWFFQNTWTTSLSNRLGAGKKKSKTPFSLLVSLPALNLFERESAQSCHWKELPPWGEWIVENKTCTVSMQKALSWMQSPKKMALCLQHTPVSTHGFCCAL